jgi:uncharacterized repeat protein (TIGR03803 family)
MNARLAARTTKLMVVAVLLCATAAQAQLTLLHEFSGGGSDGSAPYYTTPTVTGSTLYGMTRQGGDSNRGTVFKMNTSGAGYTNLHEFAGGASDGREPYGSLTLSGSTLYGMTANGGDSDRGTVFQINTDGTGFSLLHEFASGDSNERWPYGSLMLDGSTLYGMTANGGDSDRGTVFQINTNGTGFSLLHEFAGGARVGGGAGLLPQAAVLEDVPDHVALAALDEHDVRASRRRTWGTPAARQHRGDW